MDCVTLADRPICFDSSTEPLSFVLKLKLYSILFPKSIDSEV